MSDIRTLSHCHHPSLMFLPFRRHHRPDERLESAPYGKVSVIEINHGSALGQMASISRLVPH